MFGLTFGLGVAAFWVCAGQNSNSNESYVSRVTIDSALPINPEVSPKALLRGVSRSFHPEFFDLPNLGEDDHSFAYGKLIEMMGDGIFRRSENPARNGQSWLALTARRNGTYELAKLTASVKLLNSVSWPGDEKDSRLSFNTQRRIVFAVRKIKGLKPGPVLALFDKPMGSLNEEGYSDDEELSTGYRREFHIGAKSFFLRGSHGVTRYGTKLAVLVIESEGKSQVVKSTSHVPSEDRDILGSLYWAGDLDGDGKLDFYIDEFNEKGYTNNMLFLSTHDKDGQLVGLAGAFGAAGC